MKIFIILFVSVLFSFQVISAQNAHYMDVETLQEAFEKQNDTLYVYNFWATWCRPCVAELPHFEELHTTYLESKVKVILVSLDFPDGFESQLEPFLAKKKLSPEVWVLRDAFDDSEWIEEVYAEWSGSIPATLINMPSKGIYAFQEKAFEYEELEEWVGSFLENEE